MTNLSYLAKKAPLFSLAEGDFSGKNFLQDVAFFQKKIQQINKTQINAVVLSESNTYRFSVRLFALAQHGITIYIPNNSQPETLKELQQFSQFSAGSANFPAGFYSLERSVIDDENDIADKSQLSNTLMWPTTGKLIFSTSGSTGKAKLIEKHWWQLNKELSCLITTFAEHSQSINAESTFITTVPHHHIYGMLFRLLWPLKISATLERQIDYPESALNLLKANNNIVLISSPAFLKRLSKDNVFSPYTSNFNRIFSSGGKLDDNDALTLAQQLSLGITQVYGSTESGGIAHRQVTTLPAEPWTVFHDITIKCHDTTQQLLLNSPYLTDSSTITAHNWFVMDDIIELISPQQFNLLGRTDRTVKIEDKRVNLSDIEASLMVHPWVDEARIIVKQGQRDVLAAVIVLTPTGKMAQSELSKFQMNLQLKQTLSEKFNALCLPKKWRYLNELPYNPQGKLTQAALEKVFD
ncbi:AMP-binding protein [Colwellia asteriadis]|uniref:AMP-binding protein n=1 Tax=Colwellia asteriadis TaxID=517723 RepID=A0ABN1L7A0_9GAMM